MSETPQKTIRQQRAEFQADFERMAAEESPCLSPHEMLMLQNGDILSSDALDHLNDCSMCSALQGAMGIDSDLLKQFQAAANKEPTSPFLAPPPQVWRPAFDWRLAAAAVVFMSFLGVSISNFASNQVETISTFESPREASILPSSSSKEVEVTIQRPETGPLPTIKTVANQATRENLPAAAVLSQSRLTIPGNVSSEAATEQARDYLKALIMVENTKPLTPSQMEVMAAKFSSDISVPNSKISIHTSPAAFKAGLIVHSALLNPDTMISIKPVEKLHLVGDSPEARAVVP